MRIKRKREVSPHRSPEQIASAGKMYQSGVTCREIGNRLHVSASTAAKYVKRCGISLSAPGARRLITPEYLDIASSMRSSGATWKAIEAKIGFSARQLQLYIYGK